MELLFRGVLPQKSCKCQTFVIEHQRHDDIGPTCMESLSRVSPSYAHVDSLMFGAGEVRSTQRPSLPLVKPASTPLSLNRILALALDIDDPLLHKACPCLLSMALRNSVADNFASREGSFSLRCPSGHTE